MRKESVSPYDRGASDSYYNRVPQPHKWLDRLGAKSVPLTDPEEIQEYHAGYAENENMNFHKCWY